MRQGVEIETTSMARRRLLMNYEWFPELLSQLPEVVKTDHYCRKLLLHLAELADYMNEVGPWKMSKKKLTQVLASFRPWELCNPDIEAAVQVYHCSTNDSACSAVAFALHGSIAWSEWLASGDAMLHCVVLFPTMCSS